MSETKALIESKTFWAALIVVLAGLAGIGGYTLAEADQANLSELIVGIVASIGGVAAIIGRWVASKQVTSLV
jgi:hypothetical protein